MRATEAEMQTHKHAQLAGGGAFFGEESLHMPHSGVGQEILHTPHTAAHLQATFMQMGGFGQGSAGGAGPLGMGLAQHNIAAMVLAMHNAANGNGVLQPNGYSLQYAQHSMEDMEEGPGVNEGDSWNDGEMASGSEDEGGSHKVEEGIEDAGTASWHHSHVQQVSSFDGVSPNSARLEKIEYKKAKRGVYTALKEV